MGIRYYAYPVAAAMIHEARDDPMRFLSDDPLMDAWAVPEDRPPMLYLDKCWSYLQSLTWPDRLDEPRVSYQLFKGDVHYGDSTCGWWEPWIKLLEPGPVADIARDLALLGVDEVRAMLKAHCGRTSDDEPYVLSYLRQAQRFTADMSRAGSGLIYMIG